MLKKINVAILGSGNVGTDLLIKIIRSPYLNCKKFIGRSLSSEGLKKARSLVIPVSDQGIDAIVNDSKCCDLIFDATSAADHKMNALIFKELGIKAVDLTRSQVGMCCVPAINLKECLEFDNVNMITCGGQASIPIVHAITSVQSDIEYVEVVSSISSKSAGPKTRDNIDEYIENTEKGLRKLTGCHHTKAILILNPAVPYIDMQTSIYVKTNNPDMEAIYQSVTEMSKKMALYVPGYKIILSPNYSNGRIVIMIKVKGVGDFLPQYAGNLDIINCAAVAFAEEYAKCTSIPTLELV